MSTVDISIIIATRNRESVLWKTVGKAIEAIEGMRTEIIVVNDGDNSLTIPTSFSNRIIYIENLNKGVSSARNFGALHAKGELLFFIDDDMWINREIIDWINIHLIQSKKTDAVYNINWKYPPYLEEKLRYVKIGKYILSSNYNTMWGRMHADGKIPASGLYKFNAISSCSLLLSKELFNTIGRYNESISFQGEDNDLTNRINNLSIPIYCVFDTTLYHNHEDRLDLDGFLLRLRNGYNSEFAAVKAGIIQPSGNRTYRGAKRFIFEFIRISENGWIQLHKILPNWDIILLLNNKLIGILAGLQRYKAWHFVNKSNLNHF